MAEEQEALTRNYHHHTTKEGKYSTCSQDTDPHDRPGFSKDQTLKRAECSWQSLQFVWGCLSGVATTLAFAISVACVQALGEVVPTFELNCIRLGFPFLTATPIVLYKRRYARVSRKEMFGLIVYGGCLGLCNLVYFEAAKYIPVGMLGGSEASLLIVFTSVAAIVSGEKCRLLVPISILLSICGILCLTQPAFVFKFSGPVKEIKTTPVCAVQMDTPTNPFNATSGNCTANVSARQHVHSSTLSDQMTGVILIVVSTILYAASIRVQSQYLTDVNASVIISVMSTVGVVPSALAMLCLETPTFPAETPCVLLLVGHTLSAGMACWLEVVTIAFTTDIIYSLLYHLQLFFLFVAQYTVLKNVSPGYENWQEIVGAVLVFLTGVFGPSYTLYKQLKDEKGRESRNDELEIEER